MDDIFRRAARSALYAWKQDESCLEDLVSELWVWYLERPATQRKLGSMVKFQAQKAARTAALQMLASRASADDKFNGRNLYSSENVKDALLGVSNNRYLKEILPSALDSLAAQNAVYAAAIKERYEDGTIPPRGPKQYGLSRAIKSLTEHVNIIAITAALSTTDEDEVVVKEGPGSRNAVFPETRKPQGWGHSDPTGNIAVMLIEHPELRYEYLHETPIREFLGGGGYAESA